MPDEALLNRIRSEFLEMPGLRLTREQAQRLYGLEQAVCRRALDTLVDMRFLCVKPDGTYARLFDGADTPPPYPARAYFQTREGPPEGSGLRDPRVR